MAALDGITITTKTLGSVPSVELASLLFNHASRRFQSRVLAETNDIVQESDVAVSLVPSPMAMGVQTYGTEYPYMNPSGYRTPCAFLAAVYAEKMGASFAYLMLAALADPEGVESALGKTALSIFQVLDEAGSSSGSSSTASSTATITPTSTSKGHDIFRLQMAILADFFSVVLTGSNRSRTTLRTFVDRLSELKTLPNGQEAYQPVDGLSFPMALSYRHAVATNKATVTGELPPLYAPPSSLPGHTRPNLGRIRGMDEDQSYALTRQVRQMEVVLFMQCLVKTITEVAANKIITTQGPSGLRLRLFRPKNVDADGNSNVPVSV